MAVEACLNGGRTRAEHRSIPQSPSELAADALAVRKAGAFAVHVHPRDAHGAQTLEAHACDAAVAAIRAAVPGLPVGLSTSEAIDPDPFARAAAVTRWRQRPDFISVNVSESGWAGIVRAALHTGIGIEVAPNDDHSSVVRPPRARLAMPKRASAAPPARQSRIVLSERQPGPYPDARCRAAVVVPLVPGPRGDTDGTLRVGVINRLTDVVAFASVTREQFAQIG